jgi:gamma-glutamylcyclotransferase (GGCT)/AIG2-like uncharacterized protein YtfP
VRLSAARLSRDPPEAGRSRAQIGGENTEPKSSETSSLAEPAAMPDDLTIRMQHECRLFVYGTLRQGEPRHELLAGAQFIGLTTTAPTFHLVDVGPYAALVRGGPTAVSGELYVADREVRRGIDIEREVPILFTRETIELSDGSQAETYLLTTEQVRGRRRLSHGDWKKRFARNSPSQAGGAWVEWSRGRWKK